MKSLYQQGLQAPGSNYWMGGDSRQPESQVRLGSSVRLGQFEWLPGLITSGAQAYGGYENAQAQEDARKAAEAQKAAAASNAQAAATNAAAAANSQLIAGMSPMTFWLSLAGLGTVLVLGGVAIANSGSSGKKR